MNRSRKDPVREQRIHNEAIVDAGPDEQALSWYYYLENKIRFPFKAKCRAAKVVSPLKKGEAVEVVRWRRTCLRARHACPGPMARSKTGGPARSTHRCRCRRINRRGHRRLALLDRAGLLSLIYATPSEYPPLTDLEFNGQIAKSRWHSRVTGDVVNNETSWTVGRGRGSRADDACHDRAVWSAVPS